ncbi:hypothetical protein N9Y42_10840 [Mariniblastus sp.]|nr:hypothetical protein [Mariniblastus sp.]
MLFSNQEIADFINENFEPAWESVRPVPRITIDFGNGTVVNRTLHGNVATYICGSDQVVREVLPGVYSKAAYLQQLKEISEQWQVEHGASTISISRELASSVTTKTKTKAKSLEVNGDAQSVELNASLARQKLKQNLELDTLYNEQERREKIDAYLMLHPHSTPSQMKSWLYREVLHADLDDPYLGLRDALFANYPFVDD